MGSVFSFSNTTLELGQFKSSTGHVVFSYFALGEY